MTTTDTVPGLVERLHRLAPDEVTLDAVTALLREGAPGLDDLHPWVAFRDDHYARHLVARSELFDVIVLCWRPGQVTPVHDHSGQRGWVQLVSGAIEETTFAHAGGGPLPDLSAVEVDDDGVGHGVVLETTGHALVDAPGAVVTVDRERAIHRLGHPGEARLAAPTVTLHVYSRPHDSCLVFDPGTDTCRRRRLVFDTAPGYAG